jgi:hypothetical protein
MHKSNDLYNINNFCSDAVKIEEKSNIINIIVPKFVELDESFFEESENNDENINSDKKVNF